MTQLKAKDIEASLITKGFQGRASNHDYFIYYSLSGRKTIAKTKISFGAGDIGDTLIGPMAKQCKLTKAQFVDLVKCPLSRDAYEALLVSGGNL